MKFNAVDLPKMEKIQMLQNNNYNYRENLIKVHLAVDQYLKDSRY